MSYEPTGYQLRIIINVPDGHRDDFGDRKFDLYTTLLAMGDVSFEEHSRTHEEPIWKLQETHSSFRATCGEDDDD